ncbi:hypothetical protein EVAR_100981_1 [Eumeta japonica]|uniref:Uncharacterized protein n=1 Tax=Eumeta variegata TaxID=151549 RepID=A0A4C1SWT8_EUMVA|nr:hypothetical protein EVAR_100981_1 [Eumeta japonica]
MTLLSGLKANWKVKKLLRNTPRARNAINVRPPQPARDISSILLASGPGDGTGTTETTLARMWPDGAARPDIRSHQGKGGAVAGISLYKAREPPSDEPTGQPSRSTCV